MLLQILQLLQTGAEIWAQFCSCTEFIQFAVDDVDQNLNLLDARTNSMEWNPTR